MINNDLPNRTELLRDKEYKKLVYIPKIIELLIRPKDKKNGRSVTYHVNQSIE